MGEILRRIIAIFKGQVQAAWNACILESGDDYLVFARSRILEQPESNPALSFQNGDRGTATRYPRS